MIVSWHWRVGRVGVSSVLGQQEPSLTQGCPLGLAQPTKVGWLLASCNRSFVIRVFLHWPTCWKALGESGLFAGSQMLGVMRSQHSKHVVSSTINVLHWGMHWWCSLVGKSTPHTGRKRRHSARKHELSVTERWKISSHIGGT